MDQKSRRFQFTLAALLRSTLFAGLAAGTLAAARTFDFYAPFLYIAAFFFAAMAVVALIGKVSLPRWLEIVAEVALIAVALFVLGLLSRPLFLPGRVRVIFRWTRTHTKRRRRSHLIRPNLTTLGEH